MRHTDKDEDLIEGCRKGERRAQQVLFERYNRRFRTVCQRYLSDNFEAEDILLQAFLKIYQNIQKFTGEGNFEGWMRRIVVNEALMALRSKRLLFVETQEHHQNYFAEAPENLGFQLEANELMQIIQNLPEGYRAVFNLYAIEGYSHKEIGEILGISEGTSKSQLSRARTILQQKLAKMDNLASQYLQS